MSYPRISSLKTADQFRARLAQLELDLPADEELLAPDQSPLAEPLVSRAGLIGNRFCILPMEGWDGTTDGRPTELTRRRWKNFGLSGAKLIWGGEAVAVRQDGRANPNQLLMTENNLGEIEALRVLLEETHQQEFGSTEDLCVGLQLTHSGRYARPNEKTKTEPRTVYRHPVLDTRVGITNDDQLLSDDEIKRLIDDFVDACVRARKAGFRWVDVKTCHGYLGHEFLSGVDRPGEFGGSFENRTRFVRSIIEGIRAEAPGLEIGVRFSIFDFYPFQPDESDRRVGVPSASGEYRYAFGGDGTGLGIDLDEPSKFMDLLDELDIDLVCSTAGNPYGNPHIQRPAVFPPTDGYQPPEDPLVGVHRQIAATAELKRRHPNMIVVGSGYSYLQEWLPHVGQSAVRSGAVDSIGLGRMVLSYPELPADVLSGKTMARRKLCRTFSDCTSAPRNGIVSGCYPLDPYYKDMPEREQLAVAKQGLGN